MMTPLDKLKRNVEAMNFHRHNIQTIGISIISVGELGFSYTLGASQSGLPDLIATNVSQAAALHIFNTIFQSWLKEGYRDGRITDLFESPESGRDVAIYIKPIEYNDHLIDNYVTQAYKFYRMLPEFVSPKHGIRYVQVFAPDNQGKTQFEAGFNMQYHQMLVEEPIGNLQ
ncbi:TPA: DUF4262 domain-containing protein [Vibrio alginolyticus]